MSPSLSISLSTPTCVQSDPEVATCEVLEEEEEVGVRVRVVCGDRVVQA